MTSVTDFARASNPLDQFSTGGSLKAVAHTIDSKSGDLVKPKPRPNQNSQRPSWVGPQKGSNPSISSDPKMTQTVKVSYSSPGLQPPVYIAGSLGERPWEPIEMRCTQKEDGEYYFWQQFDLQEGEYQYKFRLGPGDWWVLDESKDIVDDGAGNRNNLLLVKPQSRQDSLLDTDTMAQSVALTQATKESQAPQKSDIPTPVPSQDAKDGQVVENKQQNGLSKATEGTPTPDTSLPPASKQDDAAGKTHTVDGTTSSREPNRSAHGGQDFADVPPVVHNLFKHESLRPEMGQYVSSPLHSGSEDEEEKEPINSPLFRHESLTPLHGHDSGEDADNEPTSSPLFRHESLTPLHGHDSGDEADKEPISSPLFRHESLTPLHGHDSDEEGMSPLFRHESMSPIGARSQSSTRSLRSNSASSFTSHPVEAEDLSDPTLERFPTERDGIMAHLHRASSRVPEDDTVVEGTPPSPSLSSTRSLSASASPSMSMLRESSEHLDAIHEDDAEELSPETVDQTDQSSAAQEAPLAPSTASDSEASTKSQDGKKETIPKLSISPVHEPVNRGPLTPPMTPIDELQGNGDGSVDESSPYLKAPGTPRTRQDVKTDHDASRSTSKSAEDSSENNDNTTSFWIWISKLCGGRVGTISVAVAVGVAAAFYAVIGRNSTKAREVLPSP